MAAAGQPVQVGPGGKLAPSDGDVALEGEQAGRLPGARELLQVALVVLARPVAVARTDTPVHAPAPVRRPGPAEQILQRRPPLGAQRAEGEVHHGVPEIVRCRVLAGRPQRDQRLHPAAPPCCTTAASRRDQYEVFGPDLWQADYESQALTALRPMSAEE